MHRAKRRLLPVILLLPMTAALMGAAEGEPPHNGTLGAPGCKQAQPAAAAPALALARPAPQAESSCTHAAEPSEKPEPSGEPSPTEQPSSHPATSEEPTPAPTTTAPTRDYYAQVTWEGLKGVEIDITVDGVHRHFTALQSPWFEVHPDRSHIRLIVSARASDRRKAPHGPKVLMRCWIYVRINEVRVTLASPGDHSEYVDRPATCETD